MQTLKTIGKLSKLNFKKTKFSDTIFNANKLGFFASEAYTTREVINEVLSASNISRDCVTMKSAGFAISMPDGFCSDLSIRAYKEVNTGTHIDWSPEGKVRTRTLAEHLELCKQENIPVNDNSILSVHNDTQHCYLWIPILIVGKMEARLMKIQDELNYESSDEETITEVTEATKNAFLIDKQNKVTFVPAQPRKERQRKIPKQVKMDVQKSGFDKVDIKKLDDPNYSAYVNNKLKQGGDKKKLDAFESGAHFFHKLMCATVHNILKTGISDKCDCENVKLLVHYKMQQVVDNEYVKSTIPKIPNRQLKTICQDIKNSLIENLGSCEDCIVDVCTHFPDISKNYAKVYQELINKVQKVCVKDMRLAGITRVVDLKEVDPVKKAKVVERQNFFLRPTGPMTIGEKNLVSNIANSNPEVCGEDLLNCPTNGTAHAVLRYLVNYFTYKGINKNCVVFDLQSKYRTVKKMDKGGLIVCIRNGFTEADKKYIEEQDRDFINEDGIIYKIERNNVENPTTYFVNKVDQFIRENSDLASKHRFLFNIVDCHYYISPDDLRLLNACARRHKAMIRVVGIHTPSRQGLYEFPEKNGWVLVTGNEIKMNTRENGSLYINPRVDVLSDYSDWKWLNEENGASREEQIGVFSAQTEELKLNWRDDMTSLTVNVTRQLHLNMMELVTKDGKKVDPVIRELDWRQKYTTPSTLRANDDYYMAKIENTSWDLDLLRRWSWGPICSQLELYALLINQILFEEIPLSGFLELLEIKKLLGLAFNAAIFTSIAVSSWSYYVMQEWYFIFVVLMLVAQTVLLTYVFFYGYVFCINKYIALTYLAEYKSNWNICHQIYRSLCLAMRLLARNQYIQCLVFSLALSYLGVHCAEVQKDLGPFYVNKVERLRCDLTLKEEINLNLLIQDSSQFVDFFNMQDNTYWKRVKSCGQLLSGFGDYEPVYTSTAQTYTDRLFKEFEASKIDFSVEEWEDLYWTLRDLEKNHIQLCQDSRCGWQVVQTLRALMQGQTMNPEKAWQIKYSRFIVSYLYSKLYIFATILVGQLWNAFLIFRMVCNLTKKPSILKYRNEITWWLTIKTLVSIHILAPFLWFLYQNYLQVSGYSKVMNRNKIRDFITGITGLKEIIFKVKDHAKNWNVVGLQTFLTHSIADDQVRRKQKYRQPVLSAYEIQDIKLGKQVKTMTADHQSMTNMIWACRERMFNVIQQPDPKVMSEFKEYVREEFIAPLRAYIRKLDYNWFAERDFETVLKSKGYPEEKARKYLDENEKQKQGIWTKPTLQIFLKAWEEFWEGWKPRTVQGVEGAWRVIPYLSSNWAYEISADVLPGCVRHLTQNGAINLFQEQVDKGYKVLVGTDFSKFETAQGVELFKALHIPVLKMFYEEFEEHLLKLGYPLEMIQKSKKLVCKLENDCVVTMGQQRQLRLIMKWRAKMGSGRPETILLNTLVTLAALSFFLKKNGYKDFKVFANGDDGFTMLKQVDEGLLVQQLKDFFSDKCEEEGEHGLGLFMDYKEISIGRSVNWISKTFYISDSGRVMCWRNIMNVVYKSRYYAGGIKTFIQNPMIHSYVVAQSLALQEGGSYILSLFSQARFRMGQKTNVFITYYQWLKTFGEFFQANAIIVEPQEIDVVIYRELTNKLGYDALSLLLSLNNTMTIGDKICLAGKKTKKDKSQRKKRVKKNKKLTATDVTIYQRDSQTTHKPWIEDSMESLKLSTLFKKVMPKEEDVSLKFDLSSFLELVSEDDEEAR